jgi:putative copper resistance protein D
MTTWLILIRAVHFGACLLFFGIFAFDRFVAAPVLAQAEINVANFWKSRLRMFTAILLPIILLSGIVWFMLVASSMGGLPFRQIMQSDILEAVWNQTQFGALCKWRLTLWLAGAIAAGLVLFRSSPLQKSPVWVPGSFAGLLLGSLAWAGHGQEDSSLHLLADVLHLLVAGLWPTGLLPLAMLLGKLRGTPGVTDWVSLGALVRRFSALSLMSVAMLTMTGFVNGWYLVGSVENLFRETYGRWLLVKVILFIFAIAIGAMNLLRLKPRLMADDAPAQSAEATATQLQLNVQAELILGTAIILVVAVLGTLPPANR